MQTPFTKYFFKASILACLLTTIASVEIVIAADAADAPPEFQETKHYERIIPAQPTKHKDKIEVVEIFWYGCPHCYQFEPYIQRWLEEKPDSVEFIRIPAMFRPKWALHARAYYTAKHLELQDKKYLGLAEKLHPLFFQRLHDLKQPLDSEDDVALFFASNGVDRDDFNKAFRAFSVERKLKQAHRQAKRYGIGGVPAVIINGKFRNHRSVNGSELLRLVNFLISQESRKISTTIK